MKNQVQPAHLMRLGWTAVFFTLAFSGLAARLVYLQVFKHDEASGRAKGTTHKIFLEDPPRGNIYDINGHTLATSRPAKKVCADPMFIGPYAQLVAEAIGPLLEWEVTELAQQLQPSSITNAQGQVVPKRYIDLKRRVSLEQWEKVTQAMQDLTFPIAINQLPRKQRQFYQTLRQQAVYGIDVQERVYPNGSLASHVLGFTRTEEDDFNNFTVREIRGVTGIESWLNRHLAGVRGWRVTEIDRRRQELVSHREQDVEPRPGLNVVLTLDLVVQNIVELALHEAMETYQPLSASAVVVRPRTGEILAMASLPNYNPNRPGDSPVSDWRNRVICDQMEPGSTFKIVTISAALNENLVTLEDRVDCEHGIWYYNRRPLRDAHPHDILTVLEVLCKSSNIGSAKLALKLGEQRLYDYAHAYGFGTKTGITLGGEVSGQLPPVKSWDGLTITRMPMGHSVAVTHLQMTMAMSAIANNGWLMRPMLVRRLVDQEGHVLAEYPPQPVRQVISPEAARDITIALKAVVAPGGTGLRAVLDYYQVAGKTGTAEIPTQGGYLRDKNIHSFMGFLPADAPEICISVVLDRPEKGRYASSTAAPTFRHIAELAARHLGLRPDRLTETNQVETLTERPAPASGRGRAAALRRSPSQTDGLDRARPESTRACPGRVAFRQHDFDPGAESDATSPRANHSLASIPHHSIPKEGDKHKAAVSPIDAVFGTRRSPQQHRVHISPMVSAHTPHCASGCLRGNTPSRDLRGTTAEMMV